MLGVNSSLNALVQYVFPALSPTIDVGTFDVPLGTRILCSIQCMLGWTPFIRIMAAMADRDGTGMGAGAPARQLWQGIEVPWIVQLRRSMNSLTISLYCALAQHIL